ncbi:MAG: pitrilysin family protein [Phycisphaeraceae bacterium]
MRHMIAVAAVLTVWFFALGVPALAQEAVAPPEVAPEVAPQAASPTVRYTILQEHPDRLLGQLPNGLIFIVQEIHTAPVVSAQVWIKTGSIYEQEHTGAGLSHFLEHLLSGGTTSTRSEKDTNKILGAIGAQTNAATSLDSVRYYIDTTSEHAPKAIDLLSDYMRNNLITPEEYTREREVIQNEFSMGEGDPGRIFWKLTQQARFQFHPARHPTIGYLDEFLKISRDEIYAFYKRMYVPNNMIFVVAGDVKKQEMADQIVKRWSDAGPGKLPEQLSFPIEPEISEPRTLSGTADVRRPRLRLAWPGTRLGQDGDYALDLLATMLGQGESSRLIRTVRDEQQLATTIVAYNMSFHWGNGFFGVDAEVSGPTPAQVQAQLTQGGENTGPAKLRDDSIQQTKAAILQQIQKIKDQGVTPLELARAKRKTLASVIYDAQTAQAMAARLASDLIATGDPDYLQRYAQAIDAITAEQIQAAARQYLEPNRLITLTLLPREPNQPAPKLTRPPDVLGRGELPREAIELDNSRLIAEFKEAQKQPIERKAAGGANPITLHVLPNGLRVLISRNTSLPAVAMQFYHLGGLLADAPGKQGVANATAKMMIKGTATRSAQEITQAIEDLGAALSVDAGNNTWYSQAMCLAGDWKTVMAIQADVIQHPAFPEDEWKKLQPRLLASIDRIRDSWSGELRLNFLARYYGDHPWSTMPVGKREVVEALTEADLRRFHADHLGASDAVLAIFGDVDPEQALAEATRLYGQVPAKPVTLFNPPVPVAAEPAVGNATTAKPLTAVQIGLGPGVTRMSPDYPAMQVLSKVLSSFPTGWLDEALRGDGPGLVYAVGAGASVGVVPGYFTVLFNTQPGDAPQALLRTNAVLDRARNEPVDVESLNRAKAAVLADEFLDKQSLGDRAGDAALNVLYGVGLDDPEKFQRRVGELTAEELRVVAQTYLRNPVTVILSHEPIKLDAPTEPKKEQ